MMNYVDFLLWVRGPAFQIATAIFIFGLSWRLLEILSLSRKPELAVVRERGIAGGFRTIFRRFLPVDDNTFQRSAFIITAGYIFHLGFFIILLLFVPHILFFREFFGFSWPGLPTPVIGIITIMTLLALIALLINRMRHPVLRFLSGFEDYFVWIVTFLPVLTGYMAFHHFFHYPLMLALHILSVELLMIVFPFTKLMHTFTWFISRWYTGSRAAQKGVQV
ncbi:MAG: hypothetical protein DRQ49_00650 [Gammaproteobacteria bacterium]|nr:MAG: hypothetical protein DRQ49_00650 [Gammaproteobacteria bacterium]RKZ44323.1 MAG: hypothetical protein DRQ41_03085 [Gammaproteobacteria bacterium]RKZ76340.1 MAG: hypothetical protein DRQ57_04305 [Gammaproteobacteria bacterium]